MRTRLSIMSPVFRDCRVTAPTHITLPTADDPPEQWQNFRDAVFAAAKTAIDQACQERPLHLRPCRPADSKPVRKLKIPGLVVPIKNKSLGDGDTVDPQKAKFREIFMQVSHPRSSVLKKCSQVATVLLKQYTHSFFSLEILDRAHLVWDFLQPARDLCAHIRTAVGVVELDIERMFPSIARQRVPHAWQRLAERYLKLYPCRRGVEDVYVAIAKGKSKDMDVFGARSPKYYNNMSLSEFHELVCLDLYTNGLFSMGCELWDQVTGVAIGGPLSAKNADAVLLEAESAVLWGLLLPAHIKLARFRDNIFCVCPLHEIVFWMDRVKSLLSAIYGMNLTVEQAGRSATFLELQVQCAGPNLEWGLKQKVLLSHLSPAPPVCRFPSPHEPHAPEVVRGLACSIAKKCVYIASTVQHRQENFAHAIWEFTAKGYPHAWWLPVFRSTYVREVPCGVPWPSLLRSLEWTCPVPPGLAVLEHDVPLPRIRLTEQLPTDEWFHHQWLRQGGGVLPTAAHLPPKSTLFPSPIILQKRTRHRPHNVPKPAGKKPGRVTTQHHTRPPTAHEALCTRKRTAWRPASPAPGQKRARTRVLQASVSPGPASPQRPRKRAPRHADCTQDVHHARKRTRPPSPAREVEPTAHTAQPKRARFSNRSRGLTEVQMGNTSLDIPASQLVHMLDWSDAFMGPTAHHEVG